MMSCTDLVPNSLRSDHPAVPPPVDEQLAVPPEGGSNTTFIIIGVFVGVAVLLTAALLFYFLYWRKRGLVSLEQVMTSPYQRM